MDINVYQSANISGINSYTFQNQCNFGGENYILCYIDQINKINTQFSNTQIKQTFIIPVTSNIQTVNITESDSIYNINKINVNSNFRLK